MFSILRVFRLCADGGAIPQNSRACLGDTKEHSMKFFATAVQNRLTYKIIAPTMQLLTCTYVLVDKK
jgi:hypothetical protein